MWKNVPRNVRLLGLVSFFNDIAAEMIYPVVPIFLTATLGAPVAIVGIIEGIAEATASLSKFIFGFLSDYFRQRKPFVVVGYSLGTLSKILIAVSTVWPLVLAARFIDRLGKGLRTAARDSMLLENATAINRGFIFGFHRSFDSLGAVLGPIIGLMLLYFLNENIRLMFFLAFIPSFIGVLLLLLFVSERHKTVSTAKRTFPKLDFQSLDPRLKLFLLVSFLFSLGNSSDAFVILRAKDLGLATTLTIFAYVLYNISQTVFATPAGLLADRIGPKKVFSGGLLVFAIVYFFFGVIRSPVWYWILFPIYGVYIAFTDGVSKAYVSKFIKKEESATYFGLHQTLMAIASFLASFIAGLLWSIFNPEMAFLYGSIMACLAFAILYFFGSKSGLNTN